MIRILFYVVVLVLLAYGAGGKFAAPFTGEPQGPAASVALADLLADPARFERLMTRTGGDPPRDGDEIPEGYRKTTEKR